MGCVCVEHLACPLLSPEQLGIITELEDTELLLDFSQATKTWQKFRA